LAYTVTPRYYRAISPQLQLQYRTRGKTAPALLTDTKVSGNTIVQSTGDDDSGVMLSFPKETVQ